MKRGGQWGAWAMIAGILVSVALIMVWERVKARSLERESQHLRQEIDRLRYQNGLLDTQILNWTAPSHLAELAHSTYHMAPAQPSQQVLAR